MLLTVVRRDKRPCGLQVQPSLDVFPVGHWFPGLDRFERAPCGETRRQVFDDLGPLVFAEVREFWYVFKRPLAHAAQRTA